MSAAVVILTLVLLVAVIAVVSRPLLLARTPEGTSKPPQAPNAPVLAELNAAREAKYREIRDTELDYRTGKLSSEDYEAVDGALRAEAMEILNRLQALEREEPDSGSPN